MAAGGLDPTYGIGGTATVSVPSDFNPTDVAVQGDGKVVIVGELRTGGDVDIAVVRLNTDGSMDASFSNDGFFQISRPSNTETASAVAIQADGKIVVTGSTTRPDRDFFVARLTTGGSLDTSFSSDGITFVVFDLDPTDRDDTAFDVAIRSNGKIVLVGRAEDGATDLDFAMAVLNSDGSLDTTFDTDGELTAGVGSGDGHAAVAALADGTMLVAGTDGDDFTVGLVQTNGSFTGDAFSFSGGVDVASDVAVGHDGKAWVIGVVDAFGSPRLGILRFNADTTLDTSFSGDGRHIVSLPGGDPFVPLKVSIQGDGKLVVFGQSNNRQVAVRLLTNGQLDPLYGTNGVAFITTTGIAADTESAVMLPNGNLIVVHGDAGQLRTSRVLASGQEIGLFRNGAWSFYTLDQLKQGVPFLASQENYNFGAAGNNAFTGDWDGDGRLDLITFSNGQWSVDTDRDGVAEANATFGPAQAEAFFADWDGNGIGDLIAYSELFRNGRNVMTFQVDSNRDGATNQFLEYGIPGDIPFLGDWDGDGALDVILYRQGPTYMQYFVDLASNGLNGGIADTELWYGLPGDRPFLGDFNGDGITDAGLFRIGDSGSGVLVNKFFFERTDDGELGGAADFEVWLLNPTPQDRSVVVPSGFSIIATDNAVINDSPLDPQFWNLQP
jgi:uncharacterized delta-60 repeat protein